MKLFRIVSLLFVLSSLLSLVAIQPTYADNPIQNPPPPPNNNTPAPATPAPTTPTTPAADSISDQQAIGLISKCKGKVGPFPADSDCGKYTICLTSAGKPSDDDVCKSVRAYNGIVTPLPAATLTGCTKAGKTADDCAAAYGNCLFFHVTNSKISAADTKTCNDLVAKGNLDAANKDPKANKSTCVIQGIGWLICPVMMLLAKVVDAAYLFVSSLLTVQPLLTNTGDANNTVYQAWSIMRNIANVAFVIAFLVIILSQVSSIGISNYGIKKLLPRIIVSAILVNISYWLCAIAVDASNIIGVSLNGLFDSINAKLAVPDSAKIAGSQGVGWEGITGGVLAGIAAVGALLYVGVSALLPALIAVLLAIVVVFLVLTLRQALIILLIIVAPLAFVAYLLPNTESWFKKWRELFQTLLFMYPIIAIMFGASALASKIVMTSANGPYKIAIQIMGAMIAIMPLALTPLVMKSAGGLLNRFGGIINNPNKGPFDRMRKGAEGYRKNRQSLRDTNALRDNKYRIGQSFVRRKARRNAVIASREAGMKDATTRYIGEQAREDNGENMFAKQMAGGGYITNADERVKSAVVASAITQEKKAFQEDVSNMEALVKVRFENPEAALEDAIKRGDKTQAVAAQNVLFNSGSSGASKFRSTVEKAESNPGMQEGLGEVTEALKSNVNDNHGSYAKQKGADITSWASDPGKKPLSQSSAPPLSDNELAGQHSGSLAKMAKQGKIGKEQAERILSDPRVSANLDDAKKVTLGQIADIDPRTDPTPQQLNIAHEEAIEENRRRP